MVDQATPAAKATSYAVSLLLDRADAVYDIDGGAAKSIGLLYAVPGEGASATCRVRRRHCTWPRLPPLSQSDYRAAQTSCDRFFEAYPKSPLMVDVKAVAAEADLQLKAYARANSGYRELLEKNPQHADANVWKVRRAVVVSLEKKPAEVVAALTPLIAELNILLELVASRRNTSWACCWWSCSIGSWLCGRVEAFAGGLACRQTGRPKCCSTWRPPSGSSLTNRPKPSPRCAGKLAGEFPNSKLLYWGVFSLGRVRLGRGRFRGGGRRLSNNC